MFRAHWFLVCFFMARLLSAQDYFLSTNGNDAQDGKSLPTAWKTLEHASQLEYQPGDNLLLQSGAEFPGTLKLKMADGGNPDKPVTITSSENERATILAGENDGILVVDSGVTIRNLALKGGAREKLKCIGIRLFNDRAADDKRSGIVLEDLEISDFAKAGIKIEGGPADKSASGFKDVRIENCKIFDGVYYGILSDGFEQPKGSWKYAHANITVRKCEVYGMPGDPEKHDNHSGNGILLGNVDGALVEYCCAHHNGEKNGSHPGGPVGIWAYCARKVVIQYCEAYENHSGEKPMDGGGFDLDGGVVESILQYNYSHDNDGAGYLVYSYKNAPHEFRDNIVRFNVSINDGRRGNYGGICVGQHDSENVNTLVHNNLVVVGPTEKGKACALVSAQTKDLKVYNNVFVVKEGAYVLGNWGLKPGEGLSIRGGTLISDTVDLADILVSKSDAALDEQGQLKLALGGFKYQRDIDFKAPTCWPQPPSALRKNLRSLPKLAAKGIDLKGVRAFPKKDFEGKLITDTEFNGPFVPEHKASK